MKNSYPIVLTPEENGFTVYIPDFDINTQGDDLTEAIEMARDAIGLMGIDMEDDGKTLPIASAVSKVKAEKTDIISLVDVDFIEYRRKNNMKAVKKNCTLPGWLDYEAEKAGVNFSAALQFGVKHALGIAE